MNRKIHQSNLDKRRYPIYAWVLIGALLTVGVFFRFYNLEKKVYWFDEAGTSLWISGYTWEEVKQMVGDREIGVNELTRFQHVNPDRGLLSTVTALSVQDPQHSPLYYGLARLWAGLFGDSVWVIRSLSAFVSLLVFPCLYWLCRELFEMRRVAWVALMIVAVSPFHVLYAQDARQYSLWTVTILLSSAVLLWTLRLQMKRSWALYAAAVVVGMYTHGLFGFVIIAHGVYVIGNRLAQTGWKLGQLWRTSVPYVTATLAGLIAFMPWLYIIVAHFDTASRHLSWATQKVNPFYLIGMWGFNFSAIFLDTDHSLKLVEQFNFHVLLSYSIRVLMLMMAVYSVYFLCSKTLKRSWLLIHAMIVTSFLGLALPDLLLGGMRSGGGYRYLIPSYLGIQLAVAFLLSTKMNSARLAQRTIWQAVTLFVIVCGIVSCTVSSQAQTWWTKPISYYHPRVARMINQAQHPLLIMGGAGKLLSLSHLLDPKVRMWLVTNNDMVQIPEGFSDVFILDPSLLLRRKLQTNHNFTIKEVDPRGKLWRLAKRH
jgi:uncharacterized membrane protein